MDWEFEEHTVHLEPCVKHLAEKLQWVASDPEKRKQLPDWNLMLRQLGKWAQEFFYPLKWKNAEKLVTILNLEQRKITVYYQGSKGPQLTIVYETNPQNPQRKPPIP